MARRALVKHSSFRLLLRRAAAPAALLIVGVFFGGYAILGPNGALAYGDIKRQLGQRKNELAALEKQRAVLQNRVNLLNPKSADPDLVDETVRKDLNVVQSDEVIVPLTSKK